MTDGQFETLLATAVNEAGILTRNRGLVVTLDDGSEFQLTIVRSRRGRGPSSDPDEDEA